MRGDNSDRKRGGEGAAEEGGCSICGLEGVLNGALASNGDGDREESVGGERDGSKRQVDARPLPIHNSNTLLDRDPGTAPTRTAPRSCVPPCPRRPLADTDSTGVHSQQQAGRHASPLLSRAGARGGPCPPGIS